MNTFIFTPHQLRALGIESDISLCLYTGERFDMWAPPFGGYCLGPIGWDGAEHTRVGPVGTSIESVLEYYRERNPVKLS